ncbi:MAG: ATP-dependent Clp protease ATP-binding subunit [Proteobacteria bacterium]|nr:ATP-dependent Clp protease ATP-binding subunit [Pseudomonadota bacterium]
MLPKTKKKFRVSDEELEDFIFKYCRDLTALAREDRFDPITGRDEEIRNVILILLQKNRKNAVLLAPAGVGKSALVVGLAQQVVKGNVPVYLKDARVLEVDLASMASGTSGPAEFQARFIPMCKALAERYNDPDYPKFVMFIDEVHTIMPMIEGSAYRGLSEVMKPYLTVGDLLVIGATTVDEYRMFVKQDPALDRRFQQVPLKVPTVEETIKILESLRPGYAKHHNIEIPDECIRKIPKYTAEHMPRRNQPDKSIIVMDQSCALYVMENGPKGKLTLDYVKRTVAVECKLHPDAIDA